MLRLHKYWLKEFFKFFFIIQVLILVLFVFIDYLSRLDRFLTADISLLGALEYVLLKLPFMFVQLTPASILLATITAFGLMNRNNELLAIRSSGISIYFLIKPAVWAGIFFAGLMFFIGETIVPVTMSRMYDIKYNVIKKKRTVSSARRDIWIKSENRLIHINFFDPAKQMVGDVTIATLGEKFQLISRIDAQKGYFKKGEWVFENILEQIHSQDSMEYTVNRYDMKTIPISLIPEDLGAVVKRSEEMSFFELRKYVQKIENEGYDATTYKVDANGKIAFPFICLIMVLTGAATGMRSFVKNNIPMGIATGVVIAFSYWVVYGFSLSLGYGLILPSILSAWAANLIFTCLVFLYLINTE